MQHRLAQHRGSALLVVLGISLLLSSIGAHYAGMVYRAFAAERSLLAILEERSLRSSEVTTLLDRIVDGEQLARFVLAGDATVLTTIGPRLIALGSDLPRIVSERDALNGMHYPSWSELRRTLPHLHCSDPAEPIGSGDWLPFSSRGRSNVSCAAPLPTIGGGFATGNIELDSIVVTSVDEKSVAPGDESMAIIAARGDIRIGRLRIECDDVRTVSIIATGSVEIGTLTPCPATPVELLVIHLGVS